MTLATLTLLFLIVTLALQVATLDLLRRVDRRTDRTDNDVIRLRLRAEGVRHILDTPDRGGLS